MKRSIWKVLAPVSLLALAACSEVSDNQGTSSEIAQTAADMAGASPEEAAAPVAADAARPGDSPDIPVSLPKLA